VVGVGVVSAAAVWVAALLRAACVAVALTSGPDGAQAESNKMDKTNSNFLLTFNFS